MLAISCWHHYSLDGDELLARLDNYCHLLLRVLLQASARKQNMTHSIVIVQGEAGNGLPRVENLNDYRCNLIQGFLKKL